MKLSHLVPKPDVRWASVQLLSHLLTVLAVCSSQLQISEATGGRALPSIPSLPSLITRKSKSPPLLHSHVVFNTHILQDVGKLVVAPCHP